MFCPATYTVLYRLVYDMLYSKSRIRPLPRKGARASRLDRCSFTKKPPQLRVSDRRSDSFVAGKSASECERQLCHPTMVHTSSHAPRLGSSGSISVCSLIGFSNPSPFSLGSPFVDCNRILIAILEEITSLYEVAEMLWSRFVYRSGFHIVHSKIDLLLTQYGKSPLCWRSDALLLLTVSVIFTDTSQVETFGRGEDDGKS